MAKKKQLNEEAEVITKALKIALQLSKDAEVVTNGGHLIATTSVGTLFVPCTFELNYAVRASDLHNAFKGCDTAYTVAEQDNEIVVAWGKRRAAIKVKPKVSVYVQPFDTVGIPDLDPAFTTVLRDVIKDLPTGTNQYSHYVKFTNGCAFWTNGISACMVGTQAYMPDVLVHVKDLKAVLNKEGLITGVGGSRSTVTFHFDDGVSIQIPLADDSTIKYPEVSKLFSADLYDASYPLTDEHLDAISYVSDFATEVIYIQPTHIGTSRDPNAGTCVHLDSMQLDLVFRPELVKLGAFNKAAFIVRNAHPTNMVSFYTYRDNITFCFVKVKVND